MVIRWFAFATCCLWAAVALAEERWVTYANPRFGAAADYPADLFTVQAPPPENGDGQTFRTADGHAELAIYGSYNTEDERPEAYVAHNAVSGTRGDAIYYERCNFPNHDVLSCFYVSYPAAEKANWDPIVARIGRSLHLAPTGSQ